MADSDYIAYQKILLETVSGLPAEQEEELYRIRNVRLAEKGFLPWEDAVGVYQPLDPKQVPKRVSADVSRPSVETVSPVPHYPANLLSNATPLSTSLTRIDSEAVLKKLHIEFAGLCNRIAAADFTKMNSKERLRSVVEKASGYLSVGLHILSRESRIGIQSAGNQFAALVQRHLLSDIFRVGYSQALKLKWRAQKWLDQAWFAHQGLSLTFWDEELLGVLGADLRRRGLRDRSATPGRRSATAVPDRR